MASPDVEGIVRDVRADVDEQRRRGIFTPEDVDIAFDERLRAYIADARIDPALGALLTQESHDWNIDSGYQIESARPGLAGSTSRIAKRIVRPIVRLYTDHVVNRQAQINVVIWRFLLDAIRRNLALELEVRRLRHDLDAIRRP